MRGIVFAYETENLQRAENGSWFVNVNVEMEYDNVVVHSAVLKFELGDDMLKAYEYLNSLDEYFNNEIEKEDLPLNLMEQVIEKEEELFEVTMCAKEEMFS